MNSKTNNTVPKIDSILPKVDSVLPNVNSDLPKFLQNMDIMQQHDLLERAAENNDTVLMGTLLQFGKMDFSVGSNKLLRVAVQNGSTDVVMLLLEDDRIDPSVNNMEALDMAAAKGFIKILTLLLGNKKIKAVIQPSHYSDCISRATLCGQEEAIKIILQYVKPEQFDPIECLATLKYVKTENKYPVCVKLLEELCDKFTKNKDSSGKLVCSPSSSLSYSSPSSSLSSNLTDSEKLAKLLEILQDVYMTQQTTKQLLAGCDHVMAINILFERKELDARARRRLVNWAVKYNDLKIMEIMLINRGTDPDVDKYVTDIIKGHYDATHKNNIF